MWHQKGPVGERERCCDVGWRNSCCLIWCMDQSFVGRKDGELNVLCDRGRRSAVMCEFPRPVKISLHLPASLCTQNNLTTMWISGYCSVADEWLNTCL